MRSFLLGAKTEVKDVPYSTDGLVAWWDGIGIGPNWTDRIRGSVIDCSGMTIGSNCVTVASGNSTSGYVVELSTQDTSVEIVCSLSSRPDDRKTFKSDNKCFGGYDGASGTRLAVWPSWGSSTAMFWNGSTRYDLTIPSTHSIVGNVGTAGTSNSAYYQNGQPIQIERLGGQESASGTGSFTVSGGCSVYAIRVYNRALTDAEIAANYAIDARRFGL